MQCFEAKEDVEDIEFSYYKEFSENLDTKVLYNDFMLYQLKR